MFSAAFHMSGNDSGIHTCRTFEMEYAKMPNLPNTCWMRPALLRRGYTIARVARFRIQHRGPNGRSPELPETSVVSLQEKRRDGGASSACALASRSLLAGLVALSIC